MSHHWIAEVLLNMTLNLNKQISSPNMFFLTDYFEFNWEWIIIAKFDVYLQFISGCQIDMESVHSAIRPLLLTLGDHRSLNPSVIQRLSYITQLFPNTFNEKLCEQLLVGNTSNVIWEIKVVLGKKIYSHSWDRNIRQFWRQEKCCPTEGLGNPILVSKILQHPRLGKQILDTRMGFPCHSLNGVLDSIIPW